MTTFAMPRTDAGDCVLHYETRGATPAIAWVLEVFDRTVTLHVMAPHVYNLTPKGAVRHISDPDVSIEHDGGFWALRPKDVAFQQWQEIIEKAVDRKK